MLFATYQRVIDLFEQNHGYLTAATLKEAKITTVQIKELVDKGVVEHVSHGHYWLIDEERGKPDHFELIEVCRVNQRAVICADSALYYQGLIDIKPKKVSVATLKTDRSRMHMNFPVKRHYYSDLAFSQDLVSKETEYGVIRYYDVERSVCDAIRFRSDIEPKVLKQIVDRFQSRGSNQMERLLAYADAMRVGKIVRSELMQINK